MDMKKTLLLLALAALTFQACERAGAGDTPEAGEPASVVIDPVITRALSLNFNEGDKIGLDIVLSGDQMHATNAPLTYQGGAFKGELKWYADGGQACTLNAYYPYQEAGFPESFTVASDQSKGTDSSDLMTASATEVYPTAAPVMMKFTHMLSQISIVVDNQAGAELDGITIKNIIPTAVITKGEDGAFTAVADPDAAKGDIVAEAITAGKNYCVIVVPQTFDNLAVAVAVKNGNTLLSGVEGAELKAGYSYTLTVTVKADRVDASIGGDIGNWEDGGNLGGGDYEVPFTEFADHFEYDGLSYDIVTLPDGNKWMSEPLAYIPLGLSVSEDPASGKIWYPYSSDGTNITVLKDAASIKANGYLYSYDAIFGLKSWDEAALAALTDDAIAADPTMVQGICPNGWHIPSAAEYYELCGAGNKPYDTENPDAAFWSSDVDYAPVLNAYNAGWLDTTPGYLFNGAYNKLIASASNCTVESFYGMHSMSYWASSTYHNYSSNSYKFWGMMTTFTLSKYPLGRLSIADIIACNTSSGYHNGVSVRCLKDKQ